MNSFVSVIIAGFVSVLGELAFVGRFYNSTIIEMVGFLMFVCGLIMMGTILGFTAGTSKRKADLNENQS